MITETRGRNHLIGYQEARQTFAEFLEDFEIALNEDLTDKETSKARKQAAVGALDFIADARAQLQITPGSIPGGNGA